MSFSFVFPLVGGSGGGGTVSSVGLSMPTNDFNIANSPVTGSDTITVTYKPQIQNLIFGSPDGITGTPLFRYLVGADLPSATTSVKGALPIATDAEALAGSITDKTVVPEALSYTFLNRQIGAITAINSAILATDTINGAFAKTQGQIDAKQNTLTIGNITGSEFSITGGVGAVIGTGVSLSLAASGVTANTYGSSTVVPVLTVNSKGIITGVTNTSISFPPSSVTSVFGRTGAVVSQSGDYTFAQIGSTPTTLAGYGITDAIVSGGSGSVSDISITGLAGSGFLNLRYQSSTPVGLANYGTLYADSIGNIGYKKNANSFTNSLYFSGTADRVYTLQDRSGTLADNFDLALKLDLSGGNANQDIDIGNFSLNAKHVKINGTGGAGHIGLKHQSANISASASESSIGADSVGDPVWKNDGGAIDKLELQSNKTSTVTGNETSVTKYLTVKGVYDWAVGLFAPKASPTFTGTVTTPDIIVSNATATTPTFFNGTKNLISTTAQLWGTWVQTWASKATPIDADTIGFYNSATTFVGVKSTLLNFWTTYLKPKADLLYIALSGGQLTGALNEAPTVTIASATTTDIGGANSASVDISGTTTITGLGTVASGIIRNVRFTGALTLTHNATSLILPNATSITTQSGDTAIFRSLGSGNWICVSYKSVTALTNLYTPYWDGTKLINSDLYRASPAGQTSGIATRSARLFQAFNTEANNENALGVYKQVSTNAYDAQVIYSNSRGLNISANNASSGSASLSNYALQIINNTSNGSYIAWLQSIDKTLAEAQLTGVNSGTIFISRDGRISSATPPVNYNTGFYFEIRPSTDSLYNKYGNFYLALIDVTNKKSGFQFIVNFNKRMTLHEDGGLLIGTGAVPNASAALDVDSTTKGFLPPRMTAAQRTAIASPAIGLMVYCTDTVEGIYVYKSTGWTFIA